MSSNNKSARRVAARKAMTAQRKNGGKGAASTSPCHGKRNSWHQLKDGFGRLLIFAARDAQIRADAMAVQKEEREAAKAAERAERLIEKVAKAKRGKLSD